MTITINADLVWTNSTPTAPLIEGGTPTGYAAGGVLNGSGMTNGAFTGRRGFRIALPSTTDFTTRNYIAFSLRVEDYDWAKNLDTVANGGVRIVFVDSSGNYAGYNLYGSDIPGTSEAPEGQANEGLLSYFVDAFADNDPRWFISPDRTPDIASGTAINWTVVDYVEVSANMAVSQAVQLYLRGLAKHDGLTITGTTTNTFLDATAAARVWNPSTYQRFKAIFNRLPYYMQSVAQPSYFCHIGPVVGNGSTATTSTESNFSIALTNTYDKSPTYRATGPMVQLDDSNTRPLTINQSASCVCTWTDFSIASADHWQFVLSGTGTATFTRGQFVRFSGFTAAHGTYTDCSWAGGSAAVQITASTAITGGVVRDGVGHGIQITGAAGDYSGLTIRLQDNTTYDVEVGSGGAGTYNLAGLTVPAGYTLKIRNVSASNAVTVQVAAGITTSATHAGGGIIVESPPLTLTIAANVSLVGAEVRIYDYNGTLNSLGDELIGGVENAAGATVAFTSVAPANEVWVQIIHAGYKEYGQVFTMPASSTTLTAILATESNA